MRGNKIVWLGLALLVVGVSVAAGVGLVLQTSTPTSAGETAVNAAKSPPPNGAVQPTGPVLAVSGTIESIDGNLLKIRDVSPASTSQALSERNVVVSDQTSLAALVPLTAKETAAAMKKFQADIKAGKNPPMPPTFRAIPIAASDLRITMVVNVSAGEDIGSAATITADKITFYAPPSTPPASGK